ARSIPRQLKRPLSGRCEPRRRDTATKSSSKSKASAAVLAAATELSFKPASLARVRRARQPARKASADNAEVDRAVADKAEARMPPALARQRHPQLLPPV